MATLTAAAAAGVAAAAAAEETERHNYNLIEQGDRLEDTPREMFSIQLGHFTEFLVE